MLKLQPHIAIADCREGHLYILAARNATLGIYDAQQGAFLLLRYKGGKEYVFTEGHIDRPGQFSTASPLEDLGKAPTFIEPEGMAGFLRDHTELPRANRLRLENLEKTHGIKLPDTLRRKLLT